jgi:hypothetical protein
MMATVGSGQSAGKPEQSPCPLYPRKSGHRMSRNNFTRRGHQMNGGSALSYLGPQFVDGIDAFPSEIDIVPPKVSVCRSFTENGPFQAKVIDHSFRR